MTYSFTGHRPVRLGGYGVIQSDKVLRFAHKIMDDLLMTTPQSRQPITVISGMAIGWDQAIAVAALVHKIKLIAAVPFRNQSLVWPQPSKTKYADILSQADEVVYTSPNIEYNRELMTVRNKWMVEHSDVLVALYDGQPVGGTFDCVEYAKDIKRPCINVWSDWEEFGKV